jgi:sugar/nucleoside kinase (ribokinase family)
MSETEIARTDPLLVEETADIDTQPLATVRPENEVQSQNVDEEAEVVEAVVAGHICLDIIPTLMDNAIAFIPGRLIEAGKAILATGGPVSNTGIALHTLGIKTRLMGKVGNDLFGQALLQLIVSRGGKLASGMVIAEGELTSYSVILSAPGMDRIFIHAPGCNDTFAANDIRYDLLETAALFHFGYPPLMQRMYRDDGAELAAIFKRAKACGVTTSLDLSMPTGSASRANWQAILQATLPYIDIFLPSIEELLLMLRRPVFEQLSKKAHHADMLHLVTPSMVTELGKQLLNMGAKVVGLKMGERGLYMRTADADALAQMGRAEPPKRMVWANRELWAPCFATQVVGTTGAGDATIAGFLLGLLRGMTPEATLAAACAVGACNVEAADALSGLQSWPEIMSRIANGWPRLLPEGKKGSPLDMRTFGWHWDETHELWVGQNA